MLIPHDPSPNLQSNARRRAQQVEDTADVTVTVVPSVGAEDVTVAPAPQRSKPSGRAAAINRRPPSR